MAQLVSKSRATHLAVTMQKPTGENRGNRDFKVPNWGEDFKLSEVCKCMKTTEFLGALEEALEVPPGTIQVEDLLTETGCWDSMAALTFMSLADEKLLVTVSGGQLEECKSVRDLVGLLGDKLAD
jgi:acyl carrier protein